MIPVARIAALSATIALSAAIDACKIQPRPAPPDPAAERDLAQAMQKTAQDPKSAEAQRELGEAYERLARPFEAADALLNATKLAPNDDRARAALARVYLSLDGFNEAFGQLKICITAHPESGDCVLGLVDILRREGSTLARQEARDLLRRFVEQNPTAPRRAEASALLADLERIAVPEGGEPESNREDEGSPTDEGTGPQKGPDPNVPGHENAERKDPVGELNPFGQAFGKALEAMRRGDAPGAEAGFRAALKLKGDDPVALAGLAHALFIQGKQAPAIEAAESAFRADPNDPQVRWVFGLVMLKTNTEAQRGLKAWEELTRDDPELAEKLGIKKMLDAIHGKAPAGGSAP